MFDSNKGKKVAKAIHESICDVFGQSEVNEFCLADWKCACETARAMLFDGEWMDDGPVYGSDDLTDLFAWVYEDLGSTDEQMDIFEGHFSDYLAAAIESANEFGF